MAFEVLFLGIYLPLFAYAGVSQKRLRDAVSARHPEAARAIYDSTHSLPRSQRWAERVSQYKKLRDAEVDAHILKVDRAETVWGWAIVGSMGLGLVGWLIAVAISASR
ncbi:MAG: hypothetical protein ACRYFW_14035 [Janthinobacterium lividum]